MTTSFLNAHLASESGRPIFSRSVIRHTPPAPIAHLRANNLNIVLVMKNNVVTRIDTKGQDTNMDHVDIARWAQGMRVENAFLDPLGAHLVLALKPAAGSADSGSQQHQQPDLLYLNKKFSKPKVASARMKGHLVTSVAWLATNTSDVVTGPILMGTARGAIFETELNSGEERIFSNALEAYWKEVHDLGKGQHLPITGLECFQVQGTKTFFILATTATRLYQFQGKVGSTEDRPMLQAVFNAQQDGPDRFVELPSSLKSSVLGLAYQPRERGRPHAKHPLFPSSFGWMTESGIYAGRIDPTADTDTVTVDCQVLHFPEVQTGNRVPKMLLLSEFHALLAYDASVRAICLLNEQVVFDHEFDLTTGKVQGMARDPISGHFFVYTDYAIHRFKVDREDRNVWKVYLEKGDFDTAEHYAAGDEIKLDRVLTRRAEQLFAEGAFLESAMTFAKTRCSFETTVLKFIQAKEKIALLNYLKRKLEAVKDRVEVTLIVVWIVDIHLASMSEIEREEELGVESVRYHEAKEDFVCLLQTRKIRDCTEQNKTSLYEIMAEHGHAHNMVRFAEVMSDHERLIKYYTQVGRFEPVLEILKKQRKPLLFYQHGSVLVQEMPSRFVDALIDQGKRLNPVKMLPALASSRRKDQELEVVRYLEFALQKLDVSNNPKGVGGSDQAVHNFLVSLYVKHFPEKLDTYFISHGFNARVIPYDPKYSLSLCRQKQMTRECVTLHCVMGHLEEAMELALEVDLDQARKCLEFAGDDEEMKRKLWLRIARFVVQQKNDIQQAMEYLRQCEGLVKIEDILPFFPDFVTIDHFKDAICDSLQEYSKHISELRVEMDESNTAAELIREEIQEYKNRYVFVRATDTCSTCSGYLMAKPFHLFSCTHRFHSDCLVEEVLPLLGPGKQRRVEELLSELNTVRGDGDDNESIDSRAPRLSRREQLKSELDDLIAAECVLCGDLVVKMVDKPLISDVHFDDIMAEWL